MKLSMSMLFEYLKSFKIEGHIAEDAMTIQGVRFLSDQMQPSSLEYVYIGQARGFIQDPQFADAIILACGRSQIICHGADYEELLNGVLSAFEHYNRLEQQLSACALSHRPLREIMECISRFLPDAMIVFDLDGKRMDSIHLDHLRDEQIAQSLFRTGGIGSDILSMVFVDSRGLVSHDLSDVPQYLHPEGEEGPGAISMYMMQDGERIGFLMYFPTSDNQVSMGLTTERMLAGYVSSAKEFTDISSLRLPDHSIFRNLLEDQPVPGEVLRKFVHSVGSPIAWSLLLFKSLGIQNRTMYSLVIRDVEGACPHVIACEYRGMIAVLTQSADLASVVTFLRARFAGKKYVIGVSAPFADLSATGNAGRQAEFAVNAFRGGTPSVPEKNAGTEGSPSAPANILYFQDLALPYMLDLLRREESVMILHPAISILSRYDADNHTDLLPTLAAYESSLLSQAGTARMLHIHLNTLKYRLRRIGELTGIDFSDPDEQLYLSLSLKLM